MTDFIIGRTTAKGISSLYLNKDGEEIYLFSQKLRKGVRDFYRPGIAISGAMNFAKANGNHAIVNTMEKLIKHIHYVENEYGIIVFQRKQDKKDWRFAKNLSRAYYRQQEYRAILDIA